MMNSIHQQLISQFNECFVSFSPFDQLLDDLTRLREQSQFSGFKTSMLITGDTGSGKSALIHHFEHQCKNDGKPCVIVTRVRPTLEETLQQMLIDVDDFRRRKIPKRISEFGLIERLLDCLKAKGVGLIIINESQELTELKSEHQRREIANKLKMISEEASVSIVFVGMPWADEILSDPQWDSRVKIRRTIPYFKLSSLDEMRRYAKSLKLLSKVIPVEERPQLEKAEYCFPLFALCKGEMRGLKHLLLEALCVVLEEGSPTITTIHCAKACEVIYGFSDEDNPFKKTIEEISVVEIEQYASSKDDKLIDRKFSKAIPIMDLLVKK
ncbi:ATP-binding protein [Photobacterium leiognathi]|uniref:ATP-binding protein n=1 Tax=Photobacterium leiognathi TaxID=553611 RepID=UPI0009BE02E3|nr:TniB family NTP-binding protein [Photobacterium leiognathi]